MRTSPTGEPCAGELHARFGGRGGREPFPTPIPVIRFKRDPRSDWWIPLRFIHPTIAFNLNGSS